MIRKLAAVLGLLCLTLFIVGGVTVKGGPGGPSPVHSASWFFNAGDKPTAGECAYTYTHADFGAGACGIIAQSSVSVNEPLYSSVTIHRVHCYYAADAVILDAADSVEVCAAYQVPGGALTTTTACADMVFSANTYETAVSTVVASIAANDFGLHLRVGTVVDANGTSDWKGTCTIEWSGSG